MVKTGNGRAPDGRASVIDQGAVFKGTITATSTVIVRGVLEGEITGPGLEVDAIGRGDRTRQGHQAARQRRAGRDLRGRAGRGLRPAARRRPHPGRLADGGQLRGGHVDPRVLRRVRAGDRRLPNQEQAVSEALALAAASVAAPAPVVGAPSAPSGHGPGLADAARRSAGPTTARRSIALRRDDDLAARRPRSEEADDRPSSPSEPRPSGCPKQRLHRSPPRSPSPLPSPSDVPQSHRLPAAGEGRRAGRGALT